MLGTASSEFIALCQSQVLLLTQALGASSTVVYLAEQSKELVSPTLVPLVAYPDNADIWTGLEDALSTMEKSLPAISKPVPGAGLLASGQEEDSEQPAFSPSNPAAVVSKETGYTVSEPIFTPGPDSSLPADSTEPLPASSQPLILPLAHEGVVLGVMVSTRDASVWNPDDYQQAERVAKTLAIACVMDQRGQWLQNQLRQRQLSQADQSQTFHDLLHQFRNPLTALQTFGKLLLKRMQVDDPNQPIAEGIVRETVRLQDLAENFDDAIARGDDDLEQAAVAVSLNKLCLPAAEELTPVDHEPGSSDQEEVNATAIEAVSPGNAIATNSDHRFHGLGRDLTIAPGTVASVAEPLLLSAAALAQERQLVLVQDISPDLPEVWLDPRALREVLSNLLDNALKYAPKGALIWVSGGLVQHLHNHLYQGIAIGDTGPGIPIQDQDHIFERHYRGVQAEGETPGTGLGLAIVEELVQAMGGHIDLISPFQVDNWLPGEASHLVRGPGSLFIVWLKTV